MYSLPWNEPGGLQSTVLQRVGYDWAAKHTWYTCNPPTKQSLCLTEMLFFIFIDFIMDSSFKKKKHKDPRLQKS